MFALICTACGLAAGAGVVALGYLVGRIRAPRASR